MTDNRFRIGSFALLSSLEDDRFMVVVPDKLRLFIKEDILSDTPVPFSLDMDADNGVGVSSDDADSTSPFSQGSFSSRTGDMP